ncbi:MAG TPA: TonB-dependent receptor, partial [Polyangiaceae bacterium]|nr:TonB-dependent receptor [Polyangiaceae bacterium]
APGWAETESTGLYQARAPQLEPETVQSVEASFEQRLGAQRLLFGVFTSEWENMIEPHVLTLDEIAELQAAGELPITARDGTTQHRNVAEIESFGWNAAFAGSIVRGKLRYGTNLTAAYTRKRDSTGNKELLPVAPQLIGNARAAYVFGSELPTPALAAYYVAERPVDRAFDSSFVPAPYAPARLELRATLTGDVPMVSGLSYRLSASYTSTSRGAYAAGARQRILAGDPQLPPDLSPIDRFNVLLGLQYQFGGESSSGDTE